jgi:hypothetical protein
VDIEYPGLDIGYPRVAQNSPWAISWAPLGLLLSWLGPVPVGNPLGLLWGLGLWLWKLPLGFWCGVCEWLKSGP